MRASDLPVIRIGLVLVAGVAVWWAYRKFIDVLPQTVKDGAEAVGVLGGLGVDMVTSPLETFGVKPNEKKGVEKSLPWETGSPTSNNDQGIDWNQF
jgi:hypothetical protein